MKCHVEGKPTCPLRQKCRDACDLRGRYVDGYEAGRAAAVAQWADHMTRMNAALRADRKPHNTELTGAPR